MASSLAIRKAVNDAMAFPSQAVCLSLKKAEKEARRATPTPWSRRRKGGGGGAERLPCLFSNNCNRYRGKPW